MYQAKYIIYIGNFKISETIVTQWLIMLFLIVMSLILTGNLKPVPETKRQHFLEWAIGNLRSFVTGVMGERFISRVPNMVSYIGTILLFFALSDIVTLLGLRSPTTDLDTTAAWALMTVALMYIMGVKFKGPSYFKEFIEPTPLLLPLNVIGELARPISLAFRPFGNILGGSIIMLLLYQLLGYVSGLIPNLSIPIGQFAIPVPLHMYFDIFAGLLQAFIFSMLTMVFVSSATED